MATVAYLSGLVVGVELLDVHQKGAKLLVRQTIPTHTQATKQEDVRH